MTSPEEDVPLDNLEEIYADFLKRFAEGEFLDIADLFAKYPQYESELRELHGRQETIGEMGMERPGSSHNGTLVNSSGVVQVKAKRYAILERIAQGGMGVVYKVYDTSLRRKLAMKLIRDRRTRKLDEPGVIDSPESVARFIREAEITAKLDHPGVVPIHDMGTDEKGRVFFTMRLVHGNRLDVIFDFSRQKKEQWSITRALDVIVKMCETLAFAHSRGVIHRDLKPANIMVGQFGETYVMDWGLAKTISKSTAGAKGVEEGADTFDEAISSAGFGMDPSNGYLETSAGSIIGTASYMPPEQAAGLLSQLDERSDVYSAGAILYELLTATRPYLNLGKYAKPKDIVRAICAGPPVPIRTLNPKVSSELAAICDKAMAREKTKRYQTMQAMADDLRAYLEDRVVSAYQSGAMAELRKWIVRNRGVAISSAVGLAVAVGGLLVAVGVQVAANAQLKTANEKVLRETNLKSVALAEKGAALIAKEDALHAEQEARRRAEGLLLAHASDENAITNPALALRLALESDAHFPSTSANSAILAALPAHHEVRTLFGHRGPIHAADVNHRGTRLVTGCSDHTAIIWDTATGKPLNFLVGHTNRVCAVRFSPDGKRVVTASFDHTAAIWDVATGKRLHELVGHSQVVWHAAFSSDGQFLATGSEDGTARIWNVETGNELLSIDDHSADIYQVEFNPDGSLLLTGSADKTAGIWDVKTGTPRFRLEDHQGGVGIARFSPEGNLVLTTAARTWNAHQADGGKPGNQASTDHAAHLWELKTGKLQHLLKHASPVTAAEFNHDGTMVVTGAADGNVGIWNSETGTRSVMLDVREGPITSVAFSPDARLIAAGTERGPARLWDAASGQNRGRLGGHTDSIIRVGFLSSEQLITASLDHTARQWNTTPAGAIQLTPTDHSEMTSTVIDPHDTRVAVYSRASNHVALCSFPEGRRIAEWDHDSPVISVHFSAGGRYVATLSDSRKTRVYAADDGRLLKEFAATGKYIQLLFSGDQFLVIVDHEHKKVASWSLQSWEAVHSHELTGARYLRVSPDAKYLLTWDGKAADLELQSIAGAIRKRLASVMKSAQDAPNHRFSDDSTYLVTWSREIPTPQIWETATGRLIPIVDAKGTSVSDIFFSPDGMSFVAACSSAPAQLWNPHTGHPVATLSGHDTANARLFIGPQGDRVVSRSLNKLSRLWNGRTGELLGLLAERDDFIESAWFSRDGNALITLNAKKDKLSIWDPGDGNRLATVSSGAHPFTNGTLSFDGRWIVTGQPDGTARIWPVNPVEYLKSQPLRKLTPNENDLFQIGREDQRRAYRHAWDDSLLIESLILVSQTPTNNSALAVVARKNAEKAMQEFVDSLPAAPTKAQKAAALGRVEQGLRKRIEPSVAIQVAFAAIYVNNGDFQKAERLLRTVLDQGDQSDPAVWNSFAAVSLGGLKRTAQDILSDFPKSDSAAAADLKWILEEQQAGQTIRIRAGGGDYVSPDGTVWKHDCFFGGGHLFGESVGLSPLSTEPIKKTSDPPLYQAERWFDADSPARERSYQIPLQVGRYRITLHFAEVIDTIPRDRILDVLAEERVVVNNYEPLAAGFATAVQQSFETQIGDGLLDLEFRSIKNNPKISAIEIVRLGN